MRSVRVYDMPTRAFRDLDPLNYNDDHTIGAVIFRREALFAIRKHYVVCGHLFISKINLITFPIDIQKEKIILLESIYNSLPAQLKNELIRFNTTDKANDRLWSRFFFQWYFLNDWNCFIDNGPFIKMCESFLEDDRIITQMLDSNISIVEPTNYDELCEMTQNGIKLSGADYINPDYMESFKYTIDALLHHYHIVFSNDEIEIVKNQICNMINKQWEESNGEL